jgi:hypothetical protein
MLNVLNWIASVCEAREALPAAVVCVVLLPVVLRGLGLAGAAGIQPGRANPQLSQRQPASNSQNPIGKVWGWVGWSGRQVQLAKGVQSAN